ncbi:vegetative incompatibility protein HET-E-1 [Colletotrichum spaethianum]|uniref:Vegetative incompatibility protein HET-E-1 n=1 Tax=Colletotrichum spaethianum TaxID=700344 RepID=A0AA37URH2_9PEZI|nr:vegetative incompatibility protein HET-E-1 [Colletotrichum spaethianum]GKT50747.1 vegetative incompatibility protein HET-E-1 [Colletotrichum spaethianum]
MSDPLSIIGSVVGIASLGITVAQGLIDYYQAFQGQAGDSAHTTKKLSRLLELLESLRQQIERRQFHEEDKVLLSSMRSSMEDCKELIGELQEQLEKLQPAPGQVSLQSLRKVSRRLAYPFRQSTLHKLDEDVDEFIGCLSLTMEIMQQSDISRLQDEIDETKALLDLVRTTQISSGVRDWLNAPDAAINFNEAAKKRHPGTGLWFVESVDFSLWLRKPRSFLWLVGFAGCGKSVLCSTAIQHAFRHRRASQTIGIAFFFFTFNDERKQDASAMLRALILQLSGQLEDRQPFLSQLHDKYRNASPPDHALTNCLLQLVRAFKDAYIILDALDESPKGKHRETLLEVLTELRGWAEPGLHVMVTSRDEVDIRDELCAEADEMIRMKNEYIDSDIASFISQHLLNSRRLRKWEDHRTRIEDELTKRAQGV